MAKFCSKCGTKLDETTGLCPNCDKKKRKKSVSQEKIIEAEKTGQKVVRTSKDSLSKKKLKKKYKAEKKEAKKAKKKEKKAKLTTGQKVCRFFLKLVLWMILLVVLVGGIIGGLTYFGVIDIPVLTDFRQDKMLEVINRKRVIVEKTDIIMESDTKGKATIIVQMPDYESLFKKSYASENPEKYLLKALVLKDYENKKIEKEASVTVENGETIIHSDEVVHELLEEALINATNALSEVE